VVSVERDARAVALASSSPGPGSVAVDRRTGAVEDLVGSLPAPALVVTNPPRVGMARAVVEQLRESGAERLAYLSCDPATLARDLKLLVQGGRYRLARVIGFDLFPQTAHVESLALMERA